MSTPPTPNGVVSKNPIIAHPTAEKEPVMSSDELDLERKLMKLKSEDGMYVLTSLTTPATLSTLVNFITQQTTAALEALKPKAIRHGDANRWTMAVPVTTINDAIWELLKEVK